MWNDFDLKRLTEPLLEWYPAHARSLSWREEATPYRVWISEIMLQQTRVEAVKLYFERFVKELPDVKSLAECGEERLLKLWEGLGYYNRARNLQAAARTVMEAYGGELPADYEELRKLKGIGSYTAGAIASIAYGICVPAVDGNVLRIIMRATGDASDIMSQKVKRGVEQALAEVIPEGRAGVWNQALMELGATVCLPNGEPLCGECPWRQLCRAYRDGSWRQLPVKKKGKERRIENRTVLLICDGNHVVLRRRPRAGLLAGMYEFPNVKGHLDRKEALREVQQMGLHPMHIKRLEDAKHIFSHIEWRMRGYQIRVDSLTREQAKLLFVKVREVKERYPIPSAFAAYTKYMSQLRPE